MLLFPCDGFKRNKSINCLNSLNIRREIWRRSLRKNKSNKVYTQKKKYLVLFLYRVGNPTLKKKRKIVTEGYNRPLPGCLLRFVGLHGQVLYHGRGYRKELILYRQNI